MAAVSSKQYIVKEAEKIEIAAAARSIKVCA
jgi:hypothetical protein